MLELSGTECKVNAFIRFKEIRKRIDSMKKETVDIKIYLADFFKMPNKTSKNKNDNFYIKLKSFCTVKKNLQENKKAIH